MYRIINGKKYMLVDVVELNGQIYEIYEDENGKQFKHYCDYVR